MAKNPECKYRVTATINADTTYELEVIKARLSRVGANFASTPSPSSPKSLRTHQNMQLDLLGPAPTCNRMSSIGHDDMSLAGACGAHPQ
jgi:hypothetical protein